MTFLWAFQLSPLPKQASWTLSRLRSSAAAADCSCTSGNMEVYFKNFLLFSALWCCSCSSTARAGWKQGQTVCLTVFVLEGVWISTAMCAPLFAFEFACASMRIFLQVWMCVFVTNAGLLCMLIFFVKWACAFTLQARVVLFLSRSIQPPSPGCSWDDVIRTFFLHVWVCVAADQCGSNHPTGPV